MPSAAPVPRGPTILTLYAAADLLTGPGCPVCRYADEAAARYLAWFALEGHADAVAVTRLCSSLGMCPRHTRALIHQPGAARRLTAVYRYVMETARGALSGPAMRPGVCPACEHDDGATVRALDTLLEGLAQGPVRERCRELGGLCIPHLHAASARGSRQVVTWLSGTLKASAGTWPTWLAGSDRDADMRRAAPPDHCDELPAHCRRVRGLSRGRLGGGRSPHAYRLRRRTLSAGPPPAAMPRPPQ